MKVACLQFNPQMGRINENIRKAEDILLRSNLPVGLDWLILPELAFTGYNFQSLATITPYLEPTTAGISTHWAVATAKHYKCHVTVGYPEVTTTEPKMQYNSTVTVDPTGAILVNYRKAFLYYTDETWSSEGTGFYSGPLGQLGNVTLGICMDINPYRFTASWTDYEFANAALTANSPVVCVSMAWLCHLTPEELAHNPSEPDLATVTYWFERFYPFLKDCMRRQPTVVILANRCGREEEACYAGSSTVMRVDGNGFALYDTLGKGDEKCLIVDLNERPKYQVRSAR